MGTTGVYQESMSDACGTGHVAPDSMALVGTTVTPKSPSQSQYKSMYRQPRAYGCDAVPYWDMWVCAWYV